jgi:hypothetical protein
MLYGSVHLPLNIRIGSADPDTEMVDKETSVLSALRREPEQASLLFKFSAIVAIGLVAWDILGTALLPEIAVKAILLLLFLSYGAGMTYFVGRLMASSRAWATGSATAASKLKAPSSRGIDLDALRRRPDELPPVPLEEVTREIPAPEAAPPPNPTAFNESYFLMRLQEQVKDARRKGAEMCVAAVHVTIPGCEMTPEIAETVAYDMARIASGQSRMMSQPLALTDSEFVFSLPSTGLDETKQFVRDIMRAFGDYWCFFGIAAFPRNASDAVTLVERARAACETSLQSGKRGQVEYAAA